MLSRNCRPALEQARLRQRAPQVDRHAPLPVCDVTPIDLVGGAAPRAVTVRAAGYWQMCGQMVSGSWRRPSSGSDSCARRRLYVCRRRSHRRLRSENDRLECPWWLTPGDLLAGVVGRCCREAAAQLEHAKLRTCETQTTHCPANPITACARHRRDWHKPGRTSLVPRWSRGRLDTGRHMDRWCREADADRARDRTRACSRLCTSADDIAPVTIVGVRLQPRAAFRASNQSTAENLQGVCQHAPRSAAKPRCRSAASP